MTSEQRTPQQLRYIYDFHQNHELTQKQEVYIKRGLSGLVNLGNTCFFNSIIQCLSNTLKLTDYFLSNKHTEEDPEQLNRRKPEFFFLKSYVNLLNHMWDNNQPIKPKSLFENLSKFIKKYSNLEQQDSHECLLYLLDYLHKSLSYEIDVDIQGEVKTSSDALMKKSLESWKTFYETQYSYIIETFNGLVINQISCKNCPYKDNVFEPYNCLSIDITSESTNLQTCLSKYFSQHTIDQWKCSDCNNMTSCQIIQQLWSVPNYLIINLKRFDNTGKKIHTHINFPIDELNITSHISSQKQDPNNYIYTLYAVNYHSGNAQGGHYWSSCKNLDNNWYLFNDGNVSRIHKTDELITKDAYILFYYRKFIKTNN